MRFFTKDEFACKCGCGFDEIDAELVELLERARLLAGIPFIITSGCRCEIHNRAIGGSATSSHLKGLAVDIRCTSSKDRFLMLSSLLDAGFTRIGIHDKFIHVDVDTQKPPRVMWMY